MLQVLPRKLKSTAMVRPAHHFCTPGRTYHTFVPKCCRVCPKIRDPADVVSPTNVFVFGADPTILLCQSTVGVAPKTEKLSTLARTYPELVNGGGFTLSSTHVCPMRRGSPLPFGVLLGLWITPYDIFPQTKRILRHFIESGIKPYGTCAQNFRRAHPVRKTSRRGNPEREMPEGIVMRGKSLVRFGPRGNSRTGFVLRGENHIRFVPRSQSPARSAELLRQAPYGIPTGLVRTHPAGCVL